MLHLQPKDMRLPLERGWRAGLRAYVRRAVIFSAVVFIAFGLLILGLHSAAATAEGVGHPPFSVWVQRLTIRVAESPAAVTVVAPARAAPLDAPMVIEPATLLAVASLFAGSAAVLGLAVLGARHASALQRASAWATVAGAVPCGLVVMLLVAADGPVLGFNRSATARALFADGAALLSAEVPVELLEDLPDRQFRLLVPYARTARSSVSGESGESAVLPGSGQLHTAREVLGKLFIFLFFIAILVSILSFLGGLTALLLSVPLSLLSRRKQGH